VSAPSSSTATSPREASNKGKIARVRQVKRARTVSDDVFEDSPLGPLYTMGILSDNDVENKLPIPTGSEGYGLTCSRICMFASGDKSVRHRDDFSIVRVSLNGHTSSAVLDTGADFTIIHQELASSLHIPFAGVNEYLTLAIGSQRIQRVKTLEPVTIS
ncbi:hypothetical protein BGW41_008256, partial [Actinomortierella wolfii]